MRTFVFLIVVLISSPLSASTVVLYGDQAVQVNSVLSDPNDLWVLPSELPSINGFVLKPEGACIDDICIPIRQDEDSSIFITRQGKAWFNVSELAKRLNQAIAVDHDTGVWSFGAIPARRSGFINHGLAPDFSLPDLNGNLVSLADFKGKKVMLLTWASW